MISNFFIPVETLRVKKRQNVVPPTEKQKLFVLRFSPLGTFFKKSSVFLEKRWFPDATSKNTDFPTNK